MARWEPDTEERLRAAALDLFLERGYDTVTVSDIAERAGLTRRSFFRYFPDKREVFFSGSDELVAEIERRLDAANPDDVAGEALRVLTDASVALFRDRDAQRLRRQVVASSTELQERDRTKTARIGAAIARSLTRHGVPAADAELIGAVYVETFRSAYDRALSDPEGDVAAELAAAVRAVGAFFTGSAS